MSTGHATRNSEPPPDAEQQNEYEAEHKCCRRYSAEREASRGHADARAGDRFVQAAITFPGFQAPDTSIVAQTTTAAPVHSTQPAAAGVLLAWEWSMRLTIAAPIAATAALTG
jgi:hypothetical protein